jgi:hypothetical protein
MTKQKGDSSFEVMVLIFMLLAVLFYGEPDVWDALQHWAKQTPVAQAKK